MFTLSAPFARARLTCNVFASGWYLDPPWVIITSSMSEIQNEPIELAEVGAGLTPVADQRPRIPEPLPVRLMVIDDVHFQTTAGLERELDRLYVSILRFERECDEEQLAYRADNARIIFNVIEVPSPRISLRPIGIEVPSLAEMEAKLCEAEIEYTRQRGLTPGTDVLVLLDPAGNWLELNEAPIVW